MKKETEKLDILIVSQTDLKHLSTARRSWIKGEEIAR